MTMTVETPAAGLGDEIRRGEGLLLSQALAMLPAPAATINTLRRWITEGVHRPGDGRLVRLEAKRAGGRWVTSAGALARFFDALEGDIGRAVAG